MPAGRFVLLETPLVASSEIELPHEVAHQVRDVLRLVPGATIDLLDGKGLVYPAELTEVIRKSVRVRMGDPRQGRAEPSVRLVLCLGMLKAAKFEWVLQKGTELGVAAFVPLLSERAVAATEAMGEAKRHRWEHILVEAVEQCGGARVPELSQPRPLMHSLASLPPGAVALMPWEEETAAPLRPALQQAVDEAGGVEHVPEVRLFIGPEGGFSAGEVALARPHGALPVTLGPRILRAETAALVAVTLVLESLGALDTTLKMNGDLF
jgi:16S rRNA (uracil1498-N3)-methyltransferase